VVFGLFFALVATCLLRAGVLWFLPRLRRLRAQTTSSGSAA